ncbi:MAG: homoserine kinase [Verrucomicrobiota bacterium]
MLSTRSHFVAFISASFAMEKITVQVPASTSNLGPGFDCLGVALHLYNFVTIARGGERRPLRIIDEAARLFFKESRLRPFPFSCEIRGDVPRSRGLGGSATIRLGVLHGLNRLARNPLDRLSILRLAARLEGHPDNAAPSALGGFTVVRGENVQRFEVSPRLHFVLLIPDFEIRTSKARRVLPSKLSRAAAVQSCANACAITAAFASCDYENLRGALADHLHQPFRQKLIPFLPRVIAAAEKAGALGAFLSGSGSTIAALTLNSPRKVANAMLRAARSTIARTVIAKADNVGAQIKFQTSRIKHSDGSLD